MAIKTFRHTFPDSGVTVIYKKVNPFIIAEARSEWQKTRPEIPFRIVEEEGPLKGQKEMLEGDPDYIERLQEWERRVDQQVMNLQITRAIVSIEEEGWQDEVAEYRLDREAADEEVKKLSEELGVPYKSTAALPKEDKYVYVVYLASATQQDLREFVDIVSNRSQPTDQGVDAALDSFRHKVQE